MSDCRHKVMRATVSAQTSLMHIAFHLFGFECEACGKKWDIGNFMDSIRRESLAIAEMSRISEELLENTSVTVQLGKRLEEEKARSKELYELLADAPGAPIFVYNDEDPNSREIQDWVKRYAGWLMKSMDECNRIGK